MPLRRLIAVAALLLLPSLAGAQTSQPAKSFFDKERKQYLENVAQYPLLKQHKIDDVFRLHIESGDLLLDTGLDPDREYQQRRAELDGMSEPAAILCWYLSQDLGQIQFELNVDDYSDPLAFGRLHLLARPVLKDRPKNQEASPESVDIEKIWQTPSGFRRVFFNQTSESCRLVIFANDGGVGGFVNMNLSEKDFVTLRRNHPTETEKWLRPILRELHQESAFAADPASAWQVLARDWPTDNSLGTKLADKIKALDADDFRVRREASDALQKYGRDAALVMLKMDRSRLSLEQNLRLDEVISRFKPLTDAESDRLGHDVNFLLDCLYGESPIARRLALQRLNAITKLQIAIDLDQPDDARIAAVNALRVKLIPPDPAAQPAQIGPKR